MFHLPTNLLGNAIRHPLIADDGLTGIESCLHEGKLHDTVTFLLAEQNDSMQSVAETARFHGYAHFSRSFKNYFGGFLTHYA